MADDRNCCAIGCKHDCTPVSDFWCRWHWESRGQKYDANAINPSILQNVEPGKHFLFSGIQYLKTEDTEIVCGQVCAVVYSNIGRRSLLQMFWPVIPLTAKFKKTKGV
jgi:hypothetical protein